MDAELSDEELLLPDQQLTFALTSPGPGTSHATSVAASRPAHGASRGRAQRLRACFASSLPCLSVAVGRQALGQPLQPMHPIQNQGQQTFADLLTAADKK